MSRKKENILDKIYFENVGIGGLFYSFPSGEMSVYGATLKKRLETISHVKSLDDLKITELANFLYVHLQETLALVRETTNPIWSTHEVPIVAITVEEICIQLVAQKYCEDPRITLGQMLDFLEEDIKPSFLNLNPHGSFFYQYLLLSKPTRNLIEKRAIEAVKSMAVLIAIPENQY